MRIYTAVNGDTWDSISYKIYGDEFVFEQVLAANPDLQDYIAFDGGEKVNLPTYIYEKDNIISAPWADPNDKNGVVTNIISAPWG